MRKKVNSFVNYRQIQIVTQAFQNLGSLTTVHGSSPQARIRLTFGMVKEFTIRRFKGREATVPRHLDRLASISAARENLHAWLQRENPCEPIAGDGLIVDDNGRQWD